MSTKIWETKGIKKAFDIKTKWYGGVKQAQVLQGIDLCQVAGETLGIVGESGCGKSTFGRVLMGLYPPTAGEIFLHGSLVKSDNDIKKLRKHIQMVFQDPYASLNPRMTVREILEEPLLIQGISNKKERKERVVDTLEQVGLSSMYGERYPHEFSGGQRQRVGIGRALITNPECIICDEPISALDVSIQVQIVSLLERLQADKGVSYVFISHDLNMVRYLSHRIAVMYLGQIVEVGDVQEIYKNPKHPYTQSLLNLNKKIEPKAPIGNILQGEVPNLLELPTGCLFASRCPEVTEACYSERPYLQGNDIQQVACFKHI